MLEFHPHASGSAGNFYTVVDGDAMLGIDPGIPFKRLQEALDFRVSDLDAVLTTHGHQDHCQAVPKLLAAGVDVYASRLCWEHMGLAGHRCKVLHPQQVEWENIGPWRVRPFETDHDAAGSLGFLIQGPSGSTLVFFTDAPFSRYTFPVPVNIWAVEANFSESLIRENVMAGTLDAQRFARTSRNHQSIERLEAMLSSNDLSKCREVFLLHLSSANSSASDFKQRIQRLVGCPVWVCLEGGGVE